MTAPDIIKLVKALLAKAEATTFPAEAEAYSAKAMGLMVKHHIDLHEIDDEDSSIVRVVHALSAPWLLHKRNVAHHLCATLGVYDVASWSAVPRSASTPYDQVEMFGTHAAIERARLILHSLVVQADRAVAKVDEVPEDFTGKLKSYRTSWLHGWVGRVGERLAEVYVEHTAQRDPSVTEKLDELLGDAAEVAQDYHPEIETPRARPVDPRAYEAGAEAADQADLGQTRFAGPRQELAR